MKNITYINAGAGSGKTHHLTETLTNLIKKGKVEPQQVILTTFTTKAANEFKEKAKAFLLREGLYDAAIQLDHAMIGTVHSVCQRIIGKYWFNLGLAPDMGVMNEEDTQYYISQSLADLVEPDELRQLHLFAQEFGISEKGKIKYNFWKEHLKKIIDFATNYAIEDFAHSEKKSLDYIRQFVASDAPISLEEEELKAMLEEARLHVESNNRIKKKDDHYQKFDALERSYPKHITVSWLFNDVAGAIQAKYGKTCSDVIERIENMWVSKDIYGKQENYIKILFRLATRWKENFAQFKKEKNLLDYNDMEKYMHLLMQDQVIATEISQSYRYLFVDEFQDSSPIQVKIFEALSRLMEHSYWVGDYKQAIYGFRGSDVALTKAVVEQISKHEEGCDTFTLSNSWRSLPDIVGVNNAIFENSFSKVLNKENIHLKPVRKNEHNEDSLRYITSQDDAEIAEHIQKLILQGAKLDEIAVLSRTNSTLDKLAKELKVRKIPSSRQLDGLQNSATYALVSSLLDIVSSSRDTLAKATVALLTETNYSTKQIIEEKILNDANAANKAEDYLSDVPLINQLLKIRPRLQQQSMASLVESMIIELNLYDIVKKMSEEPAEEIAYLQTFIKAARSYEEHSVLMNMPATIKGFLSYIVSLPPSEEGDPNGVQLCTYHRSKGLQWKYVFLLSLNEDIANIKKAVSRLAYGTHYEYTEKPTADNPYPEVYVRLTPWIYSAKINIPDIISVKIEGLDKFKQDYEDMIAENNRLFYVGMTRAQDVLLLNIKQSKTILQWPKDIGVDTISTTIPATNEWDIFGTGHKFTNFTLTQEECNALEPYSQCDETLTMALNIATPSFLKQEPRYLAPSYIQAKGEVCASHKFDKRIPLGKQPIDMAIVGDCIHQIFACIDDSGAVSQSKADEIIRSYELQNILINKEAIAWAWDNLTKYLTETYGLAKRIYHERPFRLERSGQTITGSIDLVWQTSEGDILIDFKTCPMGANAILDAMGEHYAGWYAGQLDAYTDALEASGEQVLKRYIYYPVSGLLAEIARSVEPC